MGFVLEPMKHFVAHEVLCSSFKRKPYDLGAREGMATLFKMFDCDPLEVCNCALSPSALSLSLEASGA